MISVEKSDLTPLELKLLSCRDGSQVLLHIDECLLLLSQKRRTLEEKIIIRFFCKLAASYAAILRSLHENEPQSDPDLVTEPIAALERLQTVNENLDTLVQDLLKIIKYNLNFLEQYFEYDFSNKLLNNEQILQELAEIELALRN